MYTYNKKGCKKKNNIQALKKNDRDIHTTLKLAAHGNEEDKDRDRDRETETETETELHSR